MEITFKTSPHRAVPFVESAVKTALKDAGYLMADLKYDGVRGNIVVDNSADCLWLSRVSKVIPALEHLNGFDRRWQKVLNDDRWIFPDGFMLDGELLVKGVDFNTGSGLLRTKWCSPENYKWAEGDFEVTSKKTQRTSFRLQQSALKVVLYGAMTFHDMVEGTAYEVMNLLMREHVKNIIPVLQDHFPEIEWCQSESYEVYDYVELTELYEKVRADGHEGLVVKDPLGFYQRGKKAGWYKLKPLEEADGVIAGLNWGTPGLANEGKVIGFSVLLETGRLVDANNISRALMDEFTSTVLKANALTPEDHQLLLDTDNYYNPYDGWSCQVNYMEQTKDGSLRHPSFQCFRGTEDNPKEKM
jgi:hypothetical protein